MMSSLSQISSPITVSSRVSSNIYSEPSDRRDAERTFCRTPIFYLCLCLLMTLFLHAEAKQITYPCLDLCFSFIGPPNATWLSSSSPIGPTQHRLINLICSDEVLEDNKGSLQLLPVLGSSRHIIKASSGLWWQTSTSPSSRSDMIYDPSNTPALPVKR